MRGKFAGDSRSLIARTIILVASSIALICLSVAVCLQYGFYSDGIGPAADGMPLAAAGWSFLWTTISLSINFCGKAYHPGVDIAMEFIGLGLAVGTNWLLIWWTNEGDYNSADCSYYSDLAGYDCTATHARALKACEIIGAITIMILTLMHIFLFVKACRATHILDVERKRVKAQRKSFVKLEEQSGHVKD